MDGITHTQTDEGHFYSPPPPMMGDKNVGKKGWLYSYNLKHRSTLTG